MAISFNNIPSSLLVPFVAAEFDSSQAQQGPSLLPYRAIIFGQKTNAGTAAADTLVRAPNLGAAIAAGGRGSMIHRETIGWFALNKSTELWIGVLADNAAGAAASGTIVVGGTATEDKPIALYFGGVRIVVGVSSGQAAAAIATNINAAIAAVLDLPITSTVSTATVTATFRHKGQVGNSYDIRHSFIDGEVLPAGVTLTITQLSGGTTNPSLTNLIAAMSDLWFQIWTHPYTDVTSLTAIETELAARFGPLKSMGGLAVTSASGSFSTLASLGTGRNSAHSIIVAQPGPTPLTPPMEFAAEVAALIAFYGANDPARPFQTLAMSNAIPTAETDQFDLTERDLLLHDGIATTLRAAGGVVQLERMVTTYQTNASGQPDAAYRDATTLLTLLYARFDWRNRMTTKYPRHKLANDGTRFGSGQAVMTPALGRAEALTWFRDMEELGLFEGLEQFKRDLVVERDATDPNRLNWLLPPDLVNQLIGRAASVRFRL
jgi:phage tail sheath gpL-like